MNNQAGPLNARTIVAIDAPTDADSEMIASLRIHDVYPEFGRNGYRLEQFNGRAGGVTQSLRQPGTAHITGSGHGGKDSFPVGPEYVLRVGCYEAAEVTGKIIHLLTCRAGVELGADLVRNGARAFFGYNDDFSFSTDQISTFVECDSEVDRALVSGSSAGEAHARAVDAFNRAIADFRSRGLHDAAGCLAHDLQHFCSPCINPHWGDPEARL